MTMYRYSALLTLLTAMTLSAGCGGGDTAEAPTAREAAEAVESAAERAADATTQAVQQAPEAATDAATAAAEALEEAAEAAVDRAETAVAGNLPEGVTAEMVEAGRAVYSGPGICATCHGPNGAGVPGLGSNLTDGEWLHSDGSVEGIAATVTEGVSAAQSSSGVPMMPRGGSSINDEQVRAVAAYVWTLGH